MAVAETLTALYETRDQWDLCDFCDLHSEDPLFAGAPSPGIRAEYFDLYPCRSIRLPASGDAFDASLSSTVRRNLRRYHRELAAAGPLSFETISTAEYFDDAFDALLHFHKLRRNEDGALRAEEERFHRSAARLLIQAGSGYLFIVRSGQAIAAIIYALRQSCCTYACLGAFNPEFAEFRPGWLVLDYAIKSAIAAGGTCFDFLRGDESYKKLWGAEPYMLRRLVLWRDR